MQSIYHFSCSASWCHIFSRTVIHMHTAIHEKMLLGQSHFVPYQWSSHVNVPILVTFGGEQGLARSTLTSL